MDSGAPDHRDLEEYISRHPGEDLRIAVTQEDIGGELVSIASEGLYADPRDALREFAQNAVDAEASSIVIRFSGLNVAVIDDGRGMGFSEMLLARRFARSGKSSTHNVGFRGIGVYSGFNICDSLVMVSQQTGSRKRWTMTFDFASMRRTLREFAGDDSATQTALGALIEANTTIAFDELPEDEIPSHGSTVALLEKLNADAYTVLSDLIKLRDYLRKTLPVPFDEQFEHRTIVEGRLRKLVPGFRTVDVRLANDDMAYDERITRFYPRDLRPPIFVESKWPADSGERRAVMWACFSDRTTLKNDAGIYFKKLGFTIGNGRELREKMARRPAVYDWYVGEVYVTDAAVIPNAARNWFEQNGAFRDLWLSLNEPVAALLKTAEDYSKWQRANEVITEAETEMSGRLGLQPDSAGSVLESLLSVERLKTRLEAQKIPAKDPQFHKLRARQRFLLNLVSQEQARLMALREDVGDSPVATASDGVASELSYASDVADDRGVPGTTSSDQAPGLSTSTLGLAAIFRDAGLQLSADALAALSVLEVALSDALTADQCAGIVRRVKATARSGSK